MRVGQGFDIHRLEHGRAFRLGGVLLDWPKGPLGHSDGDVLLHAIIDALLGAAGLGDIGDWFPPSDESLKDADSGELLKKVLARLEEDGWRIINLDSTVFLEAPKLGGYKEKIRKNLSVLTGLEVEKISLKAKTMEGLGAIGAEEATAAMVSLLIERK